MENGPSRRGHRRAFSSQISGIITESPILEEQPVELQPISNAQISRSSTALGIESLPPAFELVTNNGMENSAPVSNGVDTIDSKTDKSKGKPKKKRNLPSSRGTVLTIVGFFLSGLMLILSGVIVLAVEQHFAFRVASGILLTVGALFVSICLILQQKNINKMGDTMKHDLFKLFSSADG